MDGRRGGGGDDHGQGRGRGRGRGHHHDHARTDHDHAHEHDHAHDHTHDHHHTHAHDHAHAHAHAHANANASGREPGPRHGHGRGHGHGHGHAHGLAHHRELSRAASRRRLTLALGVTIVGLVAEIVGGLAAGSLALLADAGHLFSDAAALGLSAFASLIAARPASAKRTYGYHRAEILAALVNGSALVAIAILVVKEAVERMSEPAPLRAGLMLVVAVFGLLLNLACLMILAPVRESGLNARAAFLHVVSDALGSVGAIVAGVLALALGWTRADAAASIVIALLVAWSAYNLVREAVAVLMEGAPAHVDVDAVREALQDADGVVEVHDLHVWSITSGLESLSCHVVIAAGGSHAAVLARLRALLADRFGIHHVTLQIEDDTCDVGHG